MQLLVHEPDCLIMYELDSGRVGGQQVINSLFTRHYIAVTGYQILSLQLAQSPHRPAPLHTVTGWSAANCVDVGEPLENAIAADQRSSGGKPDGKMVLGLAGNV